VLLQAAVDTKELQSVVSNEMEQINIGAWSLAVGYFQTVRLHHGRNHNQQDNDVQDCISALTVDNVHILNLQRFMNSFDWRKKVSKQDIEKVAEQLVALALR
jgi:hypothetical protein